MSLTFNHNNKLFVSGSNVGIGIDKPSTLLEVKSTVGSNYATFNTTTHGHGYFGAFNEDGRVAFRTATSNGALDLKFYSSSNRIYFGGSDDTQKVGVNTVDPQASLHVYSGDAIIGRVGSNSPNSTLTVAGYDDFGLDFKAHNTWTHWKARVGHGKNFELYNDGANNNNQTLQLGKTNATQNAKVRIFSTGVFMDVGRNNNFGIASFGVNAIDSYVGDLYLDIRSSTTVTDRFEFNRGGEFVASGISVSGDVQGTGIGNRITLNDVPYLLSGDSTAEIQNLDEVLTQGNTSNLGIDVGPITGDSLYIGASTSNALTVNNSSNSVANIVSSNTYLGFNAGSYIYAADPFLAYGGVWLNPNQAIRSVEGDNSYVDLMRLDSNNLLHLGVAGGISSGGAVAIYSSGIEAVRIDEEGNVGIGTTSPSYDLHLYKDTPVLGIRSEVNNPTGSKIRFLETDTYQGAYLHYDASANAFHVGMHNGADSVLSNDSNAITVYRSNNDVSIDGSTLYVDAANNKVGIGTNTPNSKLQIGDGSSDDFVKVYFNDGTNLDIHGYGIEFNRPSSYLRPTTNLNKDLYIGTNSRNWNRISMYSSDDFLFYNATTELVRITSEGNVGIGTTNPSGELHVKSASTNANFYLQRSTYVPWRLSAGSTYLSFMQGESEKVRITNDKVGIGTTSPNHTLDVETATDDIVASFNSLDNKAAIGIYDNDTQIYLSAENGKGSFGFNVGTHANNLNIDVNGHVGIGTNSPSSPLHIDGGTTSEVLKIEADDNPYIRFVESGTIRGYTQYTSNSIYMQHNTPAGGALYIRMGSTNTAAFKGDGDFYVDTDTLYVDATNNRVGIGTTNPSTPLEIEQSGGAASIKLKRSDTSDSLILLEGSSYGYLQNTTGPLGLGGTNSDRDIYILANGDVGIGTTSPSYKLHVYGSVAGTGIGDRITLNGTPYLLSGDSTAEIQNLDEVLAQGNTSTRDISVYEITGSNLSLGNGVTDASIKLDGAFGGGDLTIQNQGGDQDILFKVNDGGITTTPLMIQGSTSNVGIGTASPSSKLEVVASGNSLGTVGLTMRNTHSTSDPEFVMGIGYAGLYDDSAVFAHSGQVVTYMKANSLNIVQTTSIASNKVIQSMANGNAYINLYDTSTNTQIASVNEIILKPANTERVRIDSAGNVGIGINDPKHKLDIYSNENVPLRIHRPSNANLNSSGAWGIGFSTRSDAVTSTTDTRAGIFSFYNGNLFLATNNTSIVSDPDAYARLTVTSAGYVGIGTTAPAKQLHVRGSAPFIRIEEDSASNKRLDLWVDPSTAIAYIGANQSAQQLSLQTANTDRIRITNAGDVGIGTTSPAEKLHVLGKTIIQAPDGSNTTLELRNPVNTDRGVRIIGVATSSGASATFDIEGFGAGGVLRSKMDWGPTSNLTYNLGSSLTVWTTTFTRNVKGRANASQGDLNLRSGHTSSPLTLGIDSTEYMRVHTDGNVGIGTTSPDRALHVRGTSAGNGYLKIENTVHAAKLELKSTTYTGSIAMDGTGGLISGGGLIIDSSTNPRIQFLQSGSCEMIINSGNVGIGTTNPTAKLQVEGSSFINGGLLKITNNSVTNYYDSDEMNSYGTYYDWKFTGTSVMRINSSGNVGIGTTNPSSKLEVNGHFSATTKSFLIDNPRGGKLQYGVVESNEHSVFVRGKNDTNDIELPEEWEWLVDPNSITVHLTSIGQIQQLFVISQDNKKIKIGGLATNGQYNYTVYGERVDVDKLQVNV